MEFTETVVLAGVAYDYDPTCRIALAYCTACAQANEVEVRVENGVPEYPGFVCTHCGAFNSPEG
ncbi:hypothetical protein DFW101_2219 [Solidesulfovibrio carbinoliphilus subsp. oakridgensis]|uniref:Uncharacterized protein n=1 Tax=Solidesulfovibrio carbinoliphilus subsp. oakridgensis TaxID=694327 RepID=G7QA73_9BACT|nr:hypothetical protein [Solidesulfovibrio carbinoliphilus]EHJ48224.1 hypothetical protein DFW101_2219 [Solidesulfovibrio carbinoliphilus subsp. oakridgensis]